MAIEGDGPEQEPQRTDGVDYLAYVEAHDFGTNAKAARDIATLLQDQNFTVRDSHGYDGKRQAEIRERAFNAFCVICQQAGVELPPLEPGLYEPFLPSGEESSRAKKEVLSNSTVIEQVEAELAQHPTIDGADELQAIIKIFKLFPAELAPGSFDHLKQEQLVAVINHHLQQADLSPVRPNYGKMNIAMATKETGPETPKKIVVVDDDASAILSSALRAAGWPNMSVDYVLHKREFRQSTPEQKEQLKTAFLDEILEHQPDVVLMDSGLDADFTGEQLVELMQKDPRCSRIRIVANTGGSAQGFKQLRTYENYNKGESLRGLRSAIESLDEEAETAT